MRTLIDRYHNRTAGHCGSGAMRNLIQHYCGLDLPEGVVFGLGAGLDSIYFETRANQPPFMLFGRGATMEVDLAQTLGIDYSEQIEADDERAWQQVRDEVLAGRPTMLSGDIFYLDYREFKVHFPSHRFVLVGFDDEREEVYVADRTDEEIQTCSMQALRLSRNPPNAMTTMNAWGRFASKTVRHGLPDACGMALRKTVERMLGMDASQMEYLQALRGGSDGVCASGLNGLQALMDAVSTWPDRDDAVTRLRYVDDAIIKFGTGGGFFRDHFVTFMEWSAQQRPDLVGPTTIMLAQQSAAQWNGLSPLLQSLSDNCGQQDGWQLLDEQLESIYETEYSLFGHLADTVLRGV